MLVETILLWITVFASVLGLVPVILQLSSLRRDLVLSVVVGVVLVASTVTLLLGFRHQHAVSSLSREIVMVLGTKRLTFEQLDQQLRKVDHTMLVEALDDAIETRNVDHTILVLRGNEDHWYDVRVYFVRSE